MEEVGVSESKKSRTTRVPPAKEWRSVYLVFELEERLESVKDVELYWENQFEYSLFLLPLSVAIEVIRTRLEHPEVCKFKIKTHLGQSVT